MVEIVAINRDRIDDVWPEVESQIQRALDYTRGELTTDYIKTQLESGNALLLLALDGAILASIVCEIVDTASLRVCHIIACGGEKADIWLDKWHEVIVPLAKEQGCRRISLSGRKGWVKKLQKYGFNYAYTTIDQEI
jgi:hypothetical protein